MAGNPFGNNGMVRPGPHTGSTFAGGSFSPRRRMTQPTAGAPAPTPGSSSMPGQRTGWNGRPLPPGLYKKQQAGRALPGPWASAAPAPAAQPAAGAPAVQGAPDPTQQMHVMPNGQQMQGPPMGQFPQQAQGPYASFIPPGLRPGFTQPGQMQGWTPPGLMRPGQGRRVVSQ
jgi:hypothetical protein